MRRIICPFHAEKTPSCVVQDATYKCFGCGKTGPITDLGLEVLPTAPKARYREDLKTKRAYIETLPRKPIRGFDFPADDRGYYILWPDHPYYKQRLYNPGPKEPKYKNPSGHQQPLFWVRRQDRPRTLLISEGEINALSLSRAFPEYDVVCPGSASNFLTKDQVNYLPQYADYGTITIVVDKDAAGTKAAIHMKALLLAKVPFTRVVLLQPDANEIYVSQGIDALRHAISKKV